MPNLAVTLKQEITRLARREIKTEIQALRKSSTQYRSEIAKLKRQTAALQSELIRLKKQGGKVQERSVEEGSTMRFSAKGVLSHRKRLGLSAADYGKLAGGVTGATIYSWEQGRSRPRVAQLSALGAVRSMGKRDAYRALEAPNQNKSKTR